MVPPLPPTSGSHTMYNERESNFVNKILREHMTSSPPVRRESVKNPLLHHLLISYVERDAQHAGGSNHTQKSWTNCEREGWTTPKEREVTEILKKRKEKEKEGQRNIIREHRANIKNRENWNIIREQLWPVTWW